MSTHVRSSIYYIIRTRALISAYRVNGSCFKTSQFQPGVRGAQGGYSNFFRIRRLGPSIYRSPPKISGISNTPKNIWNFSNPKKYPNSVPWPWKKTLNCIEMTLKLAQFCDDPKKISTKSWYPKKIFIFLKTQKNIEIQNFEPKKWTEPTYVWKYQSTPPPPGAWGGGEKGSLYNVVRVFHH